MNDKQNNSIEVCDKADTFGCLPFWMDNSFQNQPDGK